MPEKVLNMTDPACRTRDGLDRIKWVQFSASQIFARRGGKAVDLQAKYQAATASSSNLAGFLEMDVVGVSGGHPASVSDGDLLPVNMGLEKTCVFPTTGRVATIDDVGRTFDIVVVSNAQYVNMLADTKSILRVDDVIDDGGEYVSVSIPVGKRHGNL